MNDEMLESYRDGGVSQKQLLELGNRRPKIADFLRFVSDNEGVPFRSIWMFGGLEFVFDYEAHFEKIGVEGSLLASCMEGNSQAVRKACRMILQALGEAERLTQVGETQIVSRGLGVSHTAVKAFILGILDAKERYKIQEVIPELYFLLSIMLFPGEPEADSLRKSKDLKLYSSRVGSQYLNTYKIFPSYRQLAKILDVAPSTISRLFESRGEFESWVTHCKMWDDLSN